MAEATAIFTDIWSALTKEVGAKPRFPREILWLNGAPGAGKGTNTETILKLKGFTSPPIVCSDLLQTPEMKKIKDAGGLVGDREVVGLLLRKLLEPAFANGVIVDGFPRTKVQAGLVRLLKARMEELHRQDASLPAPVFHVVVLWVDERIAIERQLKRGRQIREANAKVRATGVGQLQEERPTDVDENAARKRFLVFKEQTLDALLSLKQDLHYHHIDASGDIPTVAGIIEREFGPKR